MDLKLELKKCIDERLERLRKQNHVRCGTVIVQWLSQRARTRGVDIPNRIESFSKDIYDMCENMRVEYEHGTFVVKVNGAAEQTYRKLRLGTSWFEPNEDVVLQIMAGLDDSRN